MPDHLAHARARDEHPEQTQADALAWIREDQGGQLPEVYGRETVVQAFVAGRFSTGSATAQAMASLANAVGLMQEAALQFRALEAEQRARFVNLAARDPVDEDARTRAGTYGSLATRLEAFLLEDTTPRDRIAGFALSLVQDLQDADLEGGGQIMGALELPSYVALRDALDGRPGVDAAIAAHVDEPVADQAADEASTARVGERLFSAGEADPPPADLEQRARLVREAILRAAGGEGDEEVRWAMQAVAERASPVTMALLGRLLK